MMKYPFSDAREYLVKILAIAVPVTFQSAAEYLLVFTDMAFVGRYQTA